MCVCEFYGDSPSLKSSIVLRWLFDSSSIHPFQSRTSDGLWGSFHGAAVHHCAFVFFEKTHSMTSRIESRAAPHAEITPKSIDLELEHRRVGMDFSPRDRQRPRPLH